MLKYKLYNQLNKPKEAYQNRETVGEVSDGSALPAGARRSASAAQRDERGFACYQKAHDIDPNSPYYIVSMPTITRAAEDTEKAEEEIRSALNNDELDIDTRRISCNVSRCSSSRARRIWMASMYWLFV